MPDKRKTIFDEKRGLFSPLPTRPENVLIRAGFSSKAEVALAIRIGNFVSDERRGWFRPSEAESYRKVRGCGVVLYAEVARWAGVKPVTRSVYKRRNLLRDCAPERLALRVDALRRAAAYLRHRRAEGLLVQQESEVVAGSLIYQADLLDGYCKRNPHRV